MIRKSSGNRVLLLMAGAHTYLKKWLSQTDGRRTDGRRTAVGRSYVGRRSDGRRTDGRRTAVGRSSDGGQTVVGRADGRSGPTAVPFFSRGVGLGPRLGRRTSPPPQYWGVWGGEAPPAILRGSGGRSPPSNIRLVTCV